MSTIKRLRVPLIVMFGAIVATVAFAAPANALPYTNPPTTSVNTQIPVAGGRVVLCGAGFLPGEQVTVVLDAVSHGVQYPSVVANPAGEFCTAIILDTGLRGTHRLTATTSGRTSTTTIRILGPTSGGVQVAGASASTGSAARSEGSVSVAGVSATAGTSASSGVPANGAGASAGNGSLAFTGTNAIAISALGGLLLAGGGTLLLAGRRRTANA